MINTCPRLAWLCLPALLLTLAPICADEPATPAALPSWDFEQSIQPWASLDPLNVQVLQATEPENVQSGTGALEVDYSLALGAQPSIMPPGTVAPLGETVPDLAAVSFAVKTSAPANLVAGLVEKNGALYIAPFYSPAGAWHTVSFRLADFVMVDEAQAAKDPDGRLDASEVGGVAVLDVSGVFAALSQQLPFAAPAPGPRKLWLDEVRLLSTAPPAAKVAPETVPIDLCDEATFHFVVVGGREVIPSLQPGREGDPGSYRLGYTVSPGSLFALLRTMAAGTLADTQALHLSVRAGQDMKLMIVVQQKDQTRFNWTTDLRGNDQWNELTPPWDSFQPEQANAGGLAAPSPGTINMITIVDISGLTAGGQERQSTLWLDNLYATK